MLDGEGQYFELLRPNFQNTVDFVYLYEFYWQLFLNAVYINISNKFLKTLKKFGRSFTQNSEKLWRKFARKKLKGIFKMLWNHFVLEILWRNFMNRKILAEFPWNIEEILHYFYKILENLLLVNSIAIILETC